MFKCVRVKQIWIILESGTCDGKCLVIVVETRKHIAFCGWLDAGTTGPPILIQSTQRSVCSKGSAVISLWNISNEGLRVQQQEKVSTRAHWHSLKVRPPSSSTQSNPFIHWINLVRHHFSGQGGGAERVGVGGQWPWANHGLQLSRCAWPTEQISILSWRKGEQGSPRDCWRLCMCVRALFKTFFSLIGHFFAAEHTLIELMGIYFCVSVVVCLQHLLALYVPCRVSQQYRCRGAAFWWMGPHLFAS